MRKILDKVDSEKQKKKNSTIIGIFLILIMGFSTLGYAFYSALGNQEYKGEIVEYRGIEFQQTNYGSWRFNIQGYNFETYYTPIDTENISVITTTKLQDYSNLPLYFGIETEEDINSRGVAEISRNLKQFILRIGIACLETECSENYPIKNCSDNMIIFKQDDYVRIREEGGCVYIYSNDEEAERTSDALLYKILGVQ